MEKIQLTTNQLAVKLGVDYQIAQGLVKLLLAKGLAVKVGKIPSPAGRGKPSDIWELPLSITIEIPSQTATA